MLGESAHRSWLRVRFRPGLSTPGSCMTRWAGSRGIANEYVSFGPPHFSLRQQAVNVQLARGAHEYVPVGYGGHAELDRGPGLIALCRLGTVVKLVAQIERIVGAQDGRQPIPGAAGLDLPENRVGVSVGRERRGGSVCAVNVHALRDWRTGDQARVGVPAVRLHYILLIVVIQHAIPVSR